MKIPHYLFAFACSLATFSCQQKTTDHDRKMEVEALGLNEGEIALCGNDEGGFGNVELSLSCEEKVRADFNLATALLHSFEYGEAEKVFARVIDADPECLMAYWGVAMSNFHPLWAPPTPEELKKGAGSVKIGRSLNSKSDKESAFLEAIATVYDGWEEVSHRDRLEKFELAAHSIYLKYPEDAEAAIFYALALRASADPEDKTFAKQREAGTILNKLFDQHPDHPGVAHYIIHTFDYPELADQALPAARKYALIASASAHAQHMPSHIFTRLGLWQESVESNLKSIKAATCYAEKSSIKGHWDEELHGIDYLLYAYLQQGDDDKALLTIRELDTMKAFHPLNFKVAYAIAAAPVRFALERNRWDEASTLPMPANVSWETFFWERSLINFARGIGQARSGNPELARVEIAELEHNREQLTKAKKLYEAKQVDIQIKAVTAWTRFAEGKKTDALTTMRDCADLEDATEKHPVTPGEMLPARELLADMYYQLGNYKEALAAYELDLTRHAGRFNAIYGVALSAQKIGDNQKAKEFFGRLIGQAGKSSRKELTVARKFIGATSVALIP